jgi:hypothetical protein
VRYREGDFHETVYIKCDGNTVPATPEEIISLSKRKFGVDNETTDVQYREKDWADYLSLCKEYREDLSVPTMKELQNEEIISADGYVSPVLLCSAMDTIEMIRWFVVDFGKVRKKPALCLTVEDLRALW